jgi:hypothetical protein
MPSSHQYPKVDHYQNQPVGVKPKENAPLLETDETPVVEPLNVVQGHPLSERNVMSFGQFMEERTSRSRQGSVRGPESHYSGVTIQTMASIQEELTQTKEIMADLAQSVKSLAEEMKQLKMSARNAETRKSSKRD